MRVRRGLSRETFRRGGRRICSIHEIHRRAITAAPKGFAARRSNTIWGSRTALLLTTVACFLVHAGIAPAADRRCAAISDVSFDFTTHDRRAHGSDNWPITWADDDNQYAAWGDGGGFGGTNSIGRVSLGVAKIQGSATSYSAVNVWGGKDQGNSATFAGKAYGILSVAATLYMWVMVEGAYFRESELFYSKNRGATWLSSGWRFDAPDGAFSVPTFLNFGRDYAGARDGYVYVYAPGAGATAFASRDTVDLARVSKDRIVYRQAYEFFAGMGAFGEALWTTDISKRKPVFILPGRVHWTVGVSHSGGLGCYFLFNNSASNPTQTSRAPGALAIYAAAEPWGPWRRVKAFEDFGGFGYTFSYHFAPMWISPDGLEFTLVFSGTGPNDSWNTVRGHFIIGAPSAMPPPDGHNK